jgi:hypothetical protein
MRSILEVSQHSPYSYCKLLQISAMNMLAVQTPHATADQPEFGYFLDWRGGWFGKLFKKPKKFIEKKL